MGKILIVDDSEDLTFTLAQVVRKQGFIPFTAASAALALDILKTQIIDLCFLDVGLPDLSGIALIDRIKEIAPDVSIVMLTGMNDAKTAVQALKAGAVDYILKPFDLIEFKQILSRIMVNNLAWRQAFLESREVGLEHILGMSPSMQRLKEEIRTAAEVSASVLITGETGTGKELVARAIHSLSKDSRGAFVKVDCGTLSANVIESELFGYERGAFTDARKDKKGLVEIADGGSLFLDEIGNLPVSLQPVLLRLIEESTFRRVGGLKDIQVNVRIIAATNVNIEEQVASGHFREDLFYRLNVLRLRVPPLRERENDILLLADYFLKFFSRELKKEIKGFTTGAEQTLAGHDWPGNIRELKNLMEREVIYCRSDRVSLESLPAAKRFVACDEPAVELLPLAEIERRYIKQVLSATANNKTRAAEILGITRTTLRDKLKPIGT